MVLTIYIITIILSGVALFFGLSNNMFGLFNDPIKAQFASFTTSILIILIGDRLASSLGKNNLLQEYNQLLKKKFREIPQINVIEEFSTSDDALLYVASRVQYSNTILNTKISKEVIKPRKDAGLLFTNAIKKQLKNGLIYRDLISQGFEVYSKELEQYSDKCSGNYQYQIQKDISSSFLNFIILDYGDEEELIIGWATSIFMGTEQKAFKIKDKRVITYFKDYHRSLFTLK